jgi:hypothetical protein
MSIRLALAGLFFALAACASGGAAHDAAPGGDDDASQPLIDAGAADAEAPDAEVPDAATCPPGSMTFTFTGTVQTFTVPACVTSLRITGHGAQGGTGGGLGARMSGDFAIPGGTVLTVVVGQEGLAQVGGNVQNSSGGGGGSFVYTGTTLYLAAGGGGGRCNYTGADALHPDAAGKITPDGGAGWDDPEFAGVPGAGGVGGAGGAAGIFNGTTADGGGGAGWVSAGADATIGGKNAAGSWAGGAGYCGGGGGGCGGAGGFGGGGGGGNNYGGGGGGGGYSGGGGGSDPEHGGGGGSFNSGANQDNAPGVRTGNGEVTLTW